MVCENNIDKIKEAVNSDEFYFQKLRDLFYEFLDYTITSDEILKLIDDVGNKKFNFQEYLDSHQTYKDLILLIGKIVTILDLNGYNKANWNPYDDKRSIAKAGVRQNDWVKNLLLFKLNKNLSEIPQSIKHAIQFMQQPSKNLTQLSINHRELTAKYLLNSDYEETTYFEQLKEYFSDELREHYPKNEDNLGVIISRFLYCDEVREKWEIKMEEKDNKTYWFVGSSIDGKDLADDFIENGYWSSGFKNIPQEQLKMQVGEKIAIKSSFVRKNNLPFDNGGKDVSVMSIKAIGIIKEIAEDGKKIIVDWERLNPIKEWYFYTYRQTIWALKYDDEKNKALIDFTFNDEPQDIDYFLSLPHWRGRYDAENYDFIPTNQPLNQILYGPPGTGKTYHTINRAIEIIENRVVSGDEDREELKTKFEEYKKAGQIEFITFHQSFSYEEFVEGIKANTNDNQISYDIEDGIFKNLSEKARDNYDNFIKEKNTSNSSSFDLEKFLNDFANFVEIQDEFLFYKKANIEKVYRANNGDFKSFSTGGSVKGQSLTKAIIKRDFDDFISGKIISFRDIKPTYESQSSYHGNAIYYFALYKKMKSFLDENKSTYLQDKKDIKLKNYILIIDEINRGNISKIFGELITLIEESKRIGADEEIKVKLPYSGDIFGVPKNLYILGTMNTADRSIALLDTALRRRFEFVEMMPNPKLLEGVELDGVKINKLLETINKRVEYLYDRDHTIGHAYFMELKANPTLEALENIFRNKIIPLLQEYFYDDWEKIRLVLGDGFVEKIEIKSDIFDKELIENSNYLEDEKYIYSIKEEFDFSKFKE